MVKTDVAPAVHAARFRKKPVEIEAMWFAELQDGIVVRGSLESANAIKEWSGGKAYPTHYHPEDGWCSAILISTLEGTMEARPGDWIIKGVKGEFYPCKPDIFAATYERVVSEPYVHRKDWPT